MDKFEQKEMKKIRPGAGVGGFKDKIVRLFKTNTPKQTVYRRGKKLSKPKT